MKSFLPAVFAILVLPAIGSADEFVDNFDTAKLDGRSAERGDWKFTNQQTTCVSDPELYKKFKNHGPILKWPRTFKDGVVEFEMKASSCQRVVFTLNGDGHVFRVILGDQKPKPGKSTKVTPTRIIGWKTKSSKENKGDVLKPKGLPKLSAVDGKWIKVKLAVKDGKGELAIGDFKTVVDHASLARDKTNVTLSFAFGDIAVRKYRMKTS